jgi:hypothetical protein
VGRKWAKITDSFSRIREGESVISMSRVPEKQIPRPRMILGRCRKKKSAIMNGDAQPVPVTTARLLINALNASAGATSAAIPPNLPIGAA